MGAHQQSIAKIPLAGNALMNNTISNSKQAETEKRGWPREKVIPDNNSDSIVESEDVYCSSSFTPLAFLAS